MAQKLLLLPSYRRVAEIAYISNLNLHSKCQDQNSNPGVSDNKALCCPPEQTMKNYSNLAFHAKCPQQDQEGTVCLRIVLLTHNDSCDKRKPKWQSLCSKMTKILPQAGNRTETQNIERLEHKAAGLGVHNQEEEPGACLLQGNILLAWI